MKGLYKLSLWAATLTSALTLAGCGGGDSVPVATFTAPTVTAPAATATIALGTPALSFVSPQESLDLANYTLVSKYRLPVGTGTNLLSSENSAITYNPDTDTLFTLGDSGTSITQISKTGQLIDTMTLPQDASRPQGTYFYDPEGLTYIGGGVFALVEERDRRVTQFTYKAGTTLDIATVRTVKLGTTVGNIGIEGISYDPLTSGFVLVKEKEVQGIFQTSINFAAGTASNGSATTDNSVNLFDPALAKLTDFSDIAALSNVLPTTAGDYSHLVIISQESGRIQKMDRVGKIYSSVNFDQLSGSEGVTFDKQLNMYSNNEVGTGGTSGPELWVWQPTRSAAAVGRGSNLYLTFAAEAVRGTGNIVVSNGTDVRTIPVTDTTQVVINGKTVVINPTNDLLPGGAYSVQYAAGVFKATDGTAAPAVSSASTLAFTTVADITPPTLILSSPNSNAAGVNSKTIVLTFDEAIKAGSGTFTLTGGTDTRTISVTDSSQVVISTSTVTINPTNNLLLSTTYALAISNGALTDLAGNAFAGLSNLSRLSFTTAAPVVVAPVTPSAPRLLITEVNSNAVGGDFFELFNFGTTTVDLTGWKWDDDSASFVDPTNATFPAASIAPGQRLLVLAGTDAAAFRAAWGLAATVPVVAAGGPGLGGGDAVVLFDPTGKVIASFNFRAGAAIVATDGTAIPVANASAGVTASIPNHAGLAFGGTAISSAVWDGVSTTAPTYRAASVGVLGGFAQPAAPTAIGSPGQ